MDRVKLTTETDPQQAIDNINGHDHTQAWETPIPTGGVADGAITTAKMADGAVSTEKIKNGAVDSTKLAQALLDLISQGGSGGANSPGYFSRDIPFYASDKLTIATPNRLWVNMAKKGYMLETQKTFDISADASWDSAATLWQANHDYAVNDVIYPAATKTGYYYRCTTAGKSSTLAPTFPTTLGATYSDGNVVWICELDFTVAANRKGKDFYIYSCIPANGTEPILVLSANSTVPLRYTADTSRKIGGFHTLCADVGTITGHTLSGYVAGNILPASVWDLKHRPVCSPEGMVYVDGLDIWIDIYLASYTGSYSNSPENLKLVSKYGANTADGASAEKFHWYKFSQIFSRQKKRMLHHSEFIAASIGSNQSTNIYGSADVNTTGGHIDTASRRMISNFGLEDCCGFLWQWGQDDGGTNTGGSYANAYDANDKYVGGQSYADSSRVLLGGFWSHAANCGSRCSVWINGPLALVSNCGSRGASEPLRGAY